MLTNGCYVTWGIININPCVLFPGVFRMKHITFVSLTVFHPWVFSALWLVHLITSVRFYFSFRKQTHEFTRLSLNINTPISITDRVRVSVLQEASSAVRRTRDTEDFGFYNVWTCLLQSESRKQKPEDETECRCVAVSSENCTSKHCFFTTQEGFKRLWVLEKHYIN